MKRFIAAFALMLVAGCSAQPATAPASAPAPEPTPLPPRSEPQVVVVPTPEEMCQKPDDNSGIIIGVIPGDTDGEIGMKPGWTRPFPARWFGVSIRFDRSVRVDPDSFRVKVEPERWQPAVAQVTGKPDWIHLFNVLPDGEMKEGSPGWVTVTVEQGNDLSGKPLITKPISIRLFMQEPLMPGETAVPCPAADLIPAPAGGH